ncbi:unnamed protein product [Cylicostephanus goldi]|uniref:Glycosyl hydrolase family 31 C-terminal domain-containing protein n=1 Tax=Cylicostephanus goldi TaxID=71465 RepID=A0A3P6T8K0_CYLGO|nr:unnamed protein product [Cylicostephanus goldi]
MGNVVLQGATEAQFYLPEDDWYSVIDHKYGQLIPAGNQTFPAPWESLIPVLVRGGAIIPCQKPNITTEHTRKNAFKLVIAPGTRIGRFHDTAEGFLYWDDGDSIVESFETHPYHRWHFHFNQSEDAAELIIRMEHKAVSGL